MYLGGMPLSVTRGRYLFQILAEKPPLAAGEHLQAIIGVLSLLSFTRHTGALSASNFGGESPRRETPDAAYWCRDTYSLRGGGEPPLADIGGLLLFSFVRHTGALFQILICMAGDHRIMPDSVGATIGRPKGTTTIKLCV